MTKSEEEEEEEEEEARRERKGWGRCLRRTAEEGLHTRDDDMAKGSRQRAEGQGQSL